MKLIHSREEWGGIVKALGLVFGDIGTSPIYTLTVLFLLIPATQSNVLGVLSLILWTLVIIVFIEYVLMVMTLDIHGEGGTFILRSILDQYAAKPASRVRISIIAFIGVSLLLGDGVITPSISILSAVEGVRLIPGLENLSVIAVVGASIVIAIGLFIFQSKGTDRVAGTFGPIMIVWFVTIGGLGLVSIVQTPSILRAINPWYAVNFFAEHGIAGVAILAQVILCATGAEALYADMGHLGKKPIVRAWRWVFVSLVLCYFGQGALLLRNPGAKDLLFSVTRETLPFAYVPFLVLTIFATVIASQALISGVFSIVYQGISSGAFPRMKVDFTSDRLKSQIYIPMVNWMLMCSVIFIMLLFKNSEGLAVAYGLAVTGTMSITGIMITEIFVYRKRRLLAAAAVCVTAVDLVYFGANFSKLQHGGYWSIIIATFPFCVIMLWTMGQKKVFENLRSLDLDTFLPGYGQIYAKGRNIPGCALFFVNRPESVSPYIVHCVAQSNIIYEENILFSIARTDYPFGIEITPRRELGNGLSALEVRAGYKEDVDIGKLIASIKIDPRIIFYGLEDIHTRNFFWRVFSVLKRLSPGFVVFYKLPTSKLHGVVTRVEL
jgi:KUP system potassium uptake protein